MARRTVIVRSVPGPGNTEGPVEIGRLIDLGDGSEPFGTNPIVEDTIRRDPRGQFERYHMGYSNGHTEWIPEVAVRQPQKWRAMVDKLRQQRHRTPEEARTAFDRAYAETFGG